MDLDKYHPTNEGLKLIREWMACAGRVRTAERELTSAGIHLADAKKALADWLLPGKGAPTLTVTIPVEDAFLEVRREEDDIVVVGWRNHRPPKGWA